MTSTLPTNRDRSMKARVAAKWHGLFSCISMARLALVIEPDKIKEKTAKREEINLKTGKPFCNRNDKIIFFVISFGIFFKLFGYLISRQAL